MEMDQNVIFAFILTLFAGLATGIGSCIALFTKETNKKFFSFSLGLSAGVMLYVSFVEMLFSAHLSLGEIFGEQRGGVITTVALFSGIALAAIIDRAVPSIENPHEYKFINREELSGKAKERMQSRLSRMGVITAIAITIHNFPEGIAAFMSAVESPQVGVAIAIAIAIHNIPEGIVVSVPIYYATGSRKKAFFYSFLSGLAEPLGAILAYLVLAPFISPLLLACTFAAVAGIMIFISLDELLPAAHEYGEHHLSIYGMVLGMGVMAVTLLAIN